MAQADDTMTIVSVDQETRNGGLVELWRVVLQRPDGTTALHMFPADTLEWRAAEYGIDPADRDLLLDVVLAEPWMTDGVDYTHPRALHNAETIDDARQFHLARVAEVKARYRFMGALHRRRLREESHMDPEAIAVKRDYVRRQRDDLRRQRDAAAAEPRPDPGRVTRLRDALERGRRIPAPDQPIDT